MSRPTIPASDLENPKGLVRAYLNADRMEKVVETFTGILRDYPQNVEICKILGDCYLSDEKKEKAA